MALQTRAEDEQERANAARADGDEDPKDKPDAADDEPDMGKEPSGTCAGCGMANDENAKFCDQCGGSMAAPRADDEDGDGPPSSKPRPGASAPKAMSTDASLASILGATSDSLPALKTAAIGLRQVRDAASGVFGKDKPREIVGALLAVPERLAAGQRAVDDLTAQTKSGEKKERWALAHRLNALGLAGRSRSTIFADEVDDKTGKRTAVKIQPEYARMDLDVFRGLVTSLEKGAAPTRRNPFQPDPERAEQASRDAGGKVSANSKPTPAQIARATNEPAVIRMFTRPGNTHPIEKIAETFLLEAAKAGGIQ